MKACNKLSLNTGAVMAAIKKQLVYAMEMATDELIDILRDEVLINGSGRTSWRKEAGEQIKEISRTVTDRYIQFDAGLDGHIQAASEHMFVRMMVAINGNQASGHLTSKPGQSVYDKSVTGKHLSEATTVYDLPAGFNQTGLPDNAVDNAIKRIKKLYYDMIQDAWNSIPDSTFYGNVNVSGGG